MTAVLALMLGIRPKADDFPQTWKTVETAIRTRYYARTTRKAEMDDLLKKYGELAPKATSRAEFSATVNKMIADFKDSHFGFFTTSDQSYYMMDALSHPTSAATAPQFGAWFKSTADGYTVSMVLNDSEAEKNDIRKGDVIVSVDGATFTPVDSLSTKVDKDVQLQVKRGSSTLTKKVHVNKQSLLEAFLDGSRGSRKTLDDNGRKIGYFHLWTQAGETFKSALAGAIYGPLQNTDAMILDLRDGFGGRPEGYADPFFRPDVILEWDLGPTGKSIQNFGYQRPLVVLINGGSRSAKEVLSYILQKSKRATLVGSRTAGNVLGTFPQRVGDWAYIEIPMVNVFADGIRLENNGVKPDVEVSREFDEAGKDLYLEEALKRLRNVPIYKGRTAENKN